MKHVQNVKPGTSEEINMKPNLFNFVVRLDNCTSKLQFVGFKLLTCSQTTRETTSPI